MNSGCQLDIRIRQLGSRIHHNRTSEPIAIGGFGGIFLRFRNRPRSRPRARRAEAFDPPTGKICSLPRRPACVLRGFSAGTSGGAASCSWENGAQRLPLRNEMSGQVRLQRLGQHVHPCTAGADTARPKWIIDCHTHFWSAMSQSCRSILHQAQTTVESGFGQPTRVAHAL